VTNLILKRAAASRLSGEWSEDDYDGPSETKSKQDEQADHDRTGRFSRSGSARR
jgi:hypothetical protein